MKDIPQKDIKGPIGKHIFGSVKVGEKGQIVIPKAARDLFQIVPGSTLLVLGDENSGLALITDEKLQMAISAMAASVLSTHTPNGENPTHTPTTTTQNREEGN